MTLVGPGGIGKTRLALEAASQRLGDYPHGAWFVSFADATSPEHIVPTLADALKFSFYSSEDPRIHLLNYLREKRMLLVLDNMEHLSKAAGFVREILETAPEVKCLATSREKLKLKGEWVFKVQGLTYPGGGTPEGTLEDFSAVQLFLQGARRADAVFRVTNQEKPFLVQICRGVEGMPLGIELASSWVRALSLKEIAGEVERSLGFLASSQEGIPERHRSLKAVFEQSYHLLTPEEQGVLRRMSVFRGGFRREAAEKVAGAALPAIASLIDKSFLRMAPSGRYEMHELIRQFAEEKLRDTTGEKRKTLDLHSRYYAEFLRQREEPLRTEKQRETLQEIAEDIANIRASWSWAVERRNLSDLEKAGLPLAVFYGARNLSEFDAAFGAAIEALEGDKRKGVTYWMLSTFYARAKMLRGSPKEAKEILQASLGFLRRLGGKRETAYCLDVLGNAHADLREFGEAKKRLFESIKIADSFDKLDGTLRFVKTDSLRILGMIRFEEGNLKESRAFIEDSVRVAREGGNQLQAAFGLLLLGGLSYLDPKSLLEARDLFQEALEISREFGELNGMQQALSGLGTVCQMLGDYGEARKLVQESLSIATDIGCDGDRRGRLVDLGYLSVSQREYQEARKLLQTGLEGCKSAGDEEGMVNALLGLGRASFGLGELGDAKRLFRESLSLARKINSRWGIFAGLNWLAMVACQMGDYGESEETFLLALREAVKSRSAFLLLDILVEMGNLLSKKGEKERALELAVLVQSQAGSHKRIQDRASSLLAELNSQLSPQVVAKIKKSGKARSLEEVVEKMLGERIEPSVPDTLRVLLLGSPKVFFGDREIPDKAWGLKRAKKLFCYLALLGEKGLPRDEVIEAFWPKAGPKRGLDSLYSSLTAIRKVLKAEAGVEGQVVSLEEGRCGLDLKVEVYLDVQEFESLLRKGKQGKEKDQRKAAQRALSLVRGRFCEGWYDSWVVEAERSLSEKHLEALKTFGMVCLQDGKLEESIACLEKALALDNLHEETCRNLMTAYAKAGKKKALLETYADLKTRLKKELGAEPESKTVELYGKLSR